MSKEKKMQQLREEAEARLLSRPDGKENLSTEEIKTLVHELRVHQIELEMQNQELREAQHRLEESRDQYTDLFEFAPVGYFILDEKGLILNCNLTACGMLSLDRSRLLKKPFSLFISEEAKSVDFFYKHLKKAFKEETPNGIEILLKQKDHPDFFAHINTLMMKDENGQPTRIRMSVTDISNEKNIKSMNLLLDAILHGQESERERIAAELHDSINPLLSIARLNIEAVKDHLKESAATLKKKLKSTITILENATKGIKEISSNLSPVILKSFGLSDGLRQLCQRVQGAGQLNIDYITHNLEERLDFEIELALYRIGQELLNNILVHADATEVEVQLIRHKDSIVLMISDNGVGFDTSQENIKTNGFGFKNIASRIESLGGQLRIDSVKGKGTTVSVELPI